MRIPATSKFRSRDGTVTKDAIVVNGYEDGQKDNTTLIKRPGLTSLIAIGTGQGHGITSFVNNDTGAESLYAVTDTAIYLANTLQQTNSGWTASTGAGSGRGFHRGSARDAAHRNGKAATTNG